MKFLGTACLLLALFVNTEARASNCFVREDQTKICIGNTVYYVNNAKEERTGTVENFFFDNTIQIEGIRIDHPIYRNAAEVSPAVDSLGLFKKDVSVHFKDRFGKDRTGTVSQVFANGKVLICFSAGGTNHCIWRSTFEIGVAQAQGRYEMTQPMPGQVIPAR